MLTVPAPAKSFMEKVPPLMVKAPSTVRLLDVVKVPPVSIVREPPALMLIILTELVAALVRTGYLGLPVGIVTVSAVPGTGPAPKFQFATVFQSVVASPVQIWVVAVAVKTLAQLRIAHRSS